MSKGENFFISMWNMANLLGKHDFSGGSFVNSVKARKLLSDQMNGNRFELILASCDWNCMENLRCLDSAVNEII